MIISNSRNFIFIHVPKCAGSTVTSLLSSAVRWNDLELGVSKFGEAIHPLYMARFGLWKHASAPEVRNIIGSDRFSQYFSFAFVRNPTARAVSFYTFVRKLHQSSQDEARANIEKWPATKAMLATGNFSEFIRHPEFHKEPHMHDLLAEKTEDGHRILVDLVGKVEAFEKDMRRICATIGVPFHDDYQRANTSSNAQEKPKHFYASIDDLEYIYNSQQVSHRLWRWTPQGSAIPAC